MRYRVTHYYTSSVSYVVEAESEDDAAWIVNGPDMPEPEGESAPEFCDEMIEPAEQTARKRQRAHKGE